MTSLVTRCPACTTLFKVVPDQLRISEGWVRCGQCDEVFDANENMQPPMLLDPSAANPVPDAMPEEVRAAEPEASLSEPQRDGGEDATPELAVDVLPIQAPESDPVAHDGWMHVARPEHADAAIGTNDDSDVVAWRPVTSAAMETPKASAAGFLHGLSVKHEGARSKWPLRFLGVFLAVSLAGQWVLNERDQLAAMQPAWQPVLAQGCEWLGCQVQPLRRIESLVIESSSFIKVKSDVYRLSFVVRNTAMWPLAMPAAELTLTDGRDQSVLRRVLSPADFAPQASTLAAGEELSVVVPIALKSSAPSVEKVSGYRLLVFYP